MTTATEEETSPADSLPDFPRTDAGNAAALEEIYGQGLRFVHGPDFWRLWNGSHWEDDTTGLAERIALDLVCRRYRQARDLPLVSFNHEYAWYTTSSSLSRRRAVLTCATTSPVFSTLPDEWDRDPLLLNAANGILDLRSADLRPHDRAALLSKLSPVEYHPDAACPRWEAFLHEVLQGDPDLIAFSHRLVGYLLTGDAREQAAFFLVGNGANGKTVFVETLRSLLGSYAASTPASVFLGSRDPAADLAPLLAARLVTASEGAAAHELNEALFKRVTGGDLLTCRRPHRPAFSYAPTFKLLFATNEVPRFTSQHHALKRRIHVLPFRQTFYSPAEGQTPLRDEGLRELLAAELPGILAWAVRGCLEWQRSGLRPPSDVMQETASLFRTMDPLADFLADQCRLDPDAQADTGKLWQAYLNWCRSRRHRPAFKSAVWLSRHLLQRDGLRAGRTNTGRYLIGIGIASEPPPDAPTPARSRKTTLKPG